MTMTVTIGGDVFILHFNTISEACEFLQSYSKNNNNRDINMICGWESGEDDN